MIYRFYISTNWVMLVASLIQILFKTNIEFRWCVFRSVLSKLVLNSSIFHESILLFWDLGGYSQIYAELLKNLTHLKMVSGESGKDFTG